MTDTLRAALFSAACIGVGIVGGYAHAGPAVRIQQGVSPHETGVYFGTFDMDKHPTTVTVGDIKHSRRFDIIFLEISDWGREETVVVRFVYKYLGHRLPAHVYSSCSFTGAAGEVAYVADEVDNDGGSRDPYGVVSFHPKKDVRDAGDIKCRIGTDRTFGEAIDWSLMTLDPKCLGRTEAGPRDVVSWKNTINGKTVNCYWPASLRPKP